MVEGGGGVGVRGDGEKNIPGGNGSRHGKSVEERENGHSSKNMMHHRHHLTLLLLLLLLLRGFFSLYPPSHVKGREEARMSGMIFG